MDAVVSALFIYPVKSCRAIALDRSALEARGLRHDRRWMVVDAEGQFVTQRSEPRLAQVEVAILGDTLVLSARPRARPRPPLCVPLLPRDTGPRRRVRVWRDEVEAIDCGADANQWVSDWLGSPASLVFMPDDTTRAVNPKYARSGDAVSFADGFPLLLASISSLDDLNRRLDRPVPMDRFRPNVVVGGCPAWAEDEWGRICIGDVPIRVAKPCSRCIITTTDQRTGERGVEPLRALATFRARDNEVLFAQNCIPETTGSVAVGDPVRVLLHANSS
jgi:uncharacterized protein YcbX